MAERLVLSFGESETDKSIELLDKLSGIYKELIDESSVNCHE